MLAATCLVVQLAAMLFGIEVTLIDFTLDCLNGPTARPIPCGPEYVVPISGVSRSENSTT